MNIEAHLQQIKTIAGERGWIEAEDEIAPYLAEARGNIASRARAVVCPASTEEVASLLKACNDGGIEVVPQGGNTGLCGGTVGLSAEKQIILNLRRLDRIREIDPLNYTMTVDAGVILADIQRAAQEVDRLFPLSLGAQGSCQIGGNLSTNAGGINVLRYGNARDLCLGLEVVLPSGEIWDGLKGLRKNNTGYSLKDLFVGAEGTLGVITAATLKLFPLPKDCHTAMVALPSVRTSTELLSRARAASNDNLTSFELMGDTCIGFAVEHIPGCRDPLDLQAPWYVLLVFSSAEKDGALGRRLEAMLESALEDGIIGNAVIATSESQAQSFWRLREGLVEAQKFEGASIKHDVSVPVSEVPGFIEQANEAVTAKAPGTRPCVFGHLGDGNVHYNLSQPHSMSAAEFKAMTPALNRLVYELVASKGGSFSAEHGIGMLKLPEMSRYKTDVEIRVMERIKAALDPRGIMNPGKVLAAKKASGLRR